VSAEHDEAWVNGQWERVRFKLLGPLPAYHFVELAETAA
jgi:hypothetical protein